MSLSQTLRRLARRRARRFRFPSLVGSVRICCSFPGGAGGDELELLTPLELSRILKLHHFTVTRLAREGKLPGFKVGGSWRFRKDQFERWMEERKDGKGERRRHH